jgi:hypothetical protein
LFLVGTGVAAVLLVETFSIQRELLSQIGGPKITGWLLIEKLDWFFVKAISRGDSTREQENYMYNNLAKPLCTVCAVSISS